MAHLHSLGLVHRDLTTGNVLLYPEPTDPRGWIAKVCSCALPCAVQLGRGPSICTVYVQMGTLFAGSSSLAILEPWHALDQARQIKQS